MIKNLFSQIQENYDSLTINSQRIISILCNDFLVNFDETSLFAECDELFEDLFYGDVDIILGAE